MIDRLIRWCFAIAAAGTACSSPPVAPVPAVPSAPSPAATPAGSVEAKPTPSTVGSSVPATGPIQSLDGVAADSSYPPGVRPISDEEAKEADTKCKPLKDKLVAEARKVGAGKHPIDAMMEALKTPPKVAGVDVTRCIDLIQRDLISYRAQTIEGEAITTLKRIVVGLASASSGNPSRLCPTAPPMPADLGAVRDRPWKSESTDWQHPGWKCTRIDLGGSPQRFQYELQVSATSHMYQAIARGFPVAGQPSTELFIQGKIDDTGIVQPSSEVLRRK